MKHKAILKLSALLLLLLLLLAVACSCDAAQTNPEDTTGSAETTAAVTEGDTTEESTAAETEPSLPLDGLYHLVENGTCNVTLIVPDSPTAATSNAMQIVRDALSSLSGVTRIIVGNDWIGKGKEYDSTTLEILIGNTAYPQSQQIINETGYGSYTVAGVGNKIVIAAWDDSAILQGANDFAALLGKNVDADKNIVVPFDSLGFTAVVHEALERFIPLPGFKPSSTYNTMKSTEMIFSNAEETDFDNYCALLLQNGYQQHSTNARGKVKTAIFYDDKDILTVVYEGYYKEIDVILDSTAEVSLPCMDTTYTKVCDTAFAQVGVAYKYSDSIPTNGLCYVWRLEDGRFIIFDGGFNYSLAADILKTTLDTMAVDKNNIVIATWIVSHFHGDHVGSFISFSKKYATTVTVESMLYNMPTEDQCAITNAGYGHWKNCLSAFPLYKGMKHYVAHPGQKYVFANAEIDMLYTLEMYAPKDLTYFNISSLVFNISFGSFDMMMLGDCAEESNQVIRMNYGESLEAEVVQVAHHGYKGGSTSLYRLINPIYVFWPVSDAEHSSMKSSAKSTTDRNAYFYLTNTRITNIYVAGDSVYLLAIEEDVGFTSVTHYDDIDAFGLGQPAA